MYPNVGAAGCTLKVGAAGCGLVGAGGVLGLRPRGSLYEFVLYNLNEKCMNWYKNHTVYKFVLHNLYNNCMNSFV
jgi:hypothetical protein